MLAYAVKRIGLGLLILVFVMVVMYAAVFLVPGDPATVALGPRATPELKKLLIERMGLDQPVWWQIVEFFRNALTGNLGYDVWSNRPVSTLVIEALPNTLILGLASLLTALAIGVPLGCLSVMRRGTLADGVIGVLAVSVIAVPSFVVAIYSLLVFAVALQWLPAIGAGEPGNLSSRLLHLILPSLAVGLGWIGYISRMVRASMLETLEASHIRTARAFGLPERRIIYTYALRIAVLPTITLLGVGIGQMLSSSVFAEIVFARPGIGKLVYEAISTRNYPIVSGAVLVTTVFFVLVNVAADILVGTLDPRVRASFN